jgi:hypothetical protein
VIIVTPTLLAKEAYRCLLNNEPSFRSPVEVRFPSYGLCGTATCRQADDDGPTVTIPVDMNRFVFNVTDWDMVQQDWCAFVLAWYRADTVH